MAGACIHCCIHVNSGRPSEEQQEKCDNAMETALENAELAAKSVLNATKLFVEQYYGKTQSNLVEPIQEFLENRFSSTSSELMKLQRNLKKLIFVKNSYEN